MSWDSVGICGAWTQSCSHINARGGAAATSAKLVILSPDDVVLSSTPRLRRIWVCLKTGWNKMPVSMGMMEISDHWKSIFCSKVLYPRQTHIRGLSRRTSYETQNVLRFRGGEFAIHPGKAILFHFGACRLVIGNDLCCRHLLDCANKLSCLLMAASTSMSLEVALPCDCKVPYCHQCHVLSNRLPQDWETDPAVFPLWSDGGWDRSLAASMSSCGAEAKIAKWTWTFPTFCNSGIQKGHDEIFHRMSPKSCSLCGRASLLQVWGYSLEDWRLPISRWAGCVNLLCHK